MFTESSWGLSASSALCGWDGGEVGAGQDPEGTEATGPEG